MALDLYSSPLCFLLAESQAGVPVVVIGGGFGLSWDVIVGIVVTVPSMPASVQPSCW